MRASHALPATWLVSVGEKNNSSEDRSGPVPFGRLMISFTCGVNSPMPSPPAGPGANQNEPSHQMGRIQSNLLADHATDRKGEEIHLLGAKGTNERDDGARQTRHPLRGFTA